MSRATGSCATPIARMTCGLTHKPPSRLALSCRRVHRLNLTPTQLHHPRMESTVLRKLLLTASALGCAITVSAQTPVDPPEWAEDAVTAPPRFSTSQLIPIEMPPYVTLKVGVDPETVTVGSDGVVRYVVVMRNNMGSESAAFEGILCTNGEVKTYARMGTSGKWSVVSQPQWQAMTDNLGSRHAFAISKQGACDGRATGKRESILQALKTRQSGNL